MESVGWGKYGQREQRIMNNDTHPNISISKTRLCELLGQAKVTQFDSVIIIEKY